MGKPLRNPKHERFCHAIVFDGQDPRDAYVAAGFEPNRANHNKLLRRPDIKARLNELHQHQEKAVQAARKPIAEVLAELLNQGIVCVADFLEVGSDGLTVRNLKTVRPEAGLALLIALHDGLGLVWEYSLPGRATAIQGREP
jgi:hypothetical protein